MNNLVTSPTNICPAYKEYKMQKIERPADARMIKRPVPVPKLSSTEKMIPHRIMGLKNDGTVAVVCANVKVLDAGQFKVRDVQIQSLGKNGVKVGDILGFKESDVTFSKPFILHRAHQIHQHPDHLVHADEK